MVLETMPWQLFIGLSVLLYSINSLLHRVLMKDEESDSYAQAVVFTGLVGVFSFMVLMFRGGFQSSLSLERLPLFSVLTLFTALGMIFTFRGMKLVEASKHTILLTSSRLWLIIGAILFLQETMAVQKFIGAGLILFGVLIAEWRGHKLSFNRGSFYVLAAAFFFAWGEIISFFILRDFEVFSFMVYACLIIVTILVIVRPRVIKKIPFYFKPKRALNIIVTSVNDGLANIFGFMAYQIGRNALQIGPLGATQTIVTVLLAIIILKEREKMPQKIFGAIITVIGTILLL